MAHIQANSGQRLGSAASIPSTLRVGDIRVIDNTTLEIDWVILDRASGSEVPLHGASPPSTSPYRYSLPWLRTHDYCRATGVARETLSTEHWRDALADQAEAFRQAPGLSAEVRPWGTGPPQTLLRQQRDDLMRSDDALMSLLEHVHADGLAIVEGGPTSAGAVRPVAERIAAIQPTIYGETFDVQAMASPINVAYSAVGLDMHMDLVYYESPPGLQLLHCRTFDPAVQGGESMFLDGFDCAEKLRHVDPCAFAVLAQVPATFQKVHYQRERPVHMVYRRPHFAVSPEPWSSGPHAMAQKLPGPLTGVFWAPPFEGPLRVHPGWVDAYFDAYSAWARLLAKEESVSLLQFRLQPGETIVFNNRRMLHGRQQYSLSDTAPPGASEAYRHLEGCYVNIDEYMSQLMYMRHMQRGDPVVDAWAGPRAGNQHCPVAPAKGT